MKSTFMNVKQAGKADDGNKKESDRNGFLQAPIKRKEQIAEAVFYLLVFAAILCFAMLQTYGDPPDEINRFKIVRFIMNHGRLPHGADPEVILAGYGASYAFQPILTYIIQGYLLRFLKLFTSDGYILLLAARMVNVIFGVVMAYYVRQISRELWKNPWLQWVFTLMVVFLPQNLFLHSYVNTDSMAMLSTAMIIYALLRAQRTDYGRKECILLAAGIILCAMSYYNAYGLILAAMLLFFLHYVEIYNGEKEGRKGVTVRWRELFQKGSFISLIVLAGIGWWFVRNAVLYGGDIFAMEARRLCSIETATADYNPLTRFTYAGEGIPIREMLFTTGYLTLLRDSFIAMFGPMIIPTHGLIYLYYKRFWIVTGIAAVLPVKHHKSSETECMPGELVKHYGGNKRNSGIWLDSRVVQKGRMGCFYAGMVLFCLITIGLSIYYSYTWEFQPQGRYILPVLIPLMILVTLGIQKICILLERAAGCKVLWDGRFMAAGQWAGKLLCLGWSFYVMAAFAYSLLNRFIPYYLERENMFSMLGKVFEM